MIFNETNNTTSTTIILLHGGGLSDWSWNNVIKYLEPTFNIITPIIDGHGEDSMDEFISIEDCAKKVIHYIQENYDGKVYALAGLSIGAQIVTEILSQEANITEYAIIESALVYPLKGTTALTVPTYTLFYGLIQQRWFAKMQSKTLCVPDNMFERYYTDSKKMTKQSLIHMTLSNGNYKLKESLSKTSAKVLVIVGSKEIKIMKKSATLLHEKIKDSKLFIAQGMQHGELSLTQPKQYVEQMKLLFTIKRSPHENK